MVMKCRSCSRTQHLAPGEIRTHDHAIKSSTLPTEPTLLPQSNLTLEGGLCGGSGRTDLPWSRHLVRYYHFGITPLNYYDSDGVRIYV